MTTPGARIARSALLWTIIAAVGVAAIVPATGCRNRRRKIVRVEPVPTLPEDLDPETIAFIDADYEPERMQTRPLIIFADSPDNPEVGEQFRQILADPQALAEREVIVVEIYALGVSKYRGQPLSPASAKAWQDRFRAGRWDFEAVLVGKDSGVRLRSPKAVTVEELAAKIDELPMRRREMYERSLEPTGEP